MKISGFGYLLKQGAKNVWINRLMSIACIGVMTACLLIVGASMLVSLNITRFMGVHRKSKRSGSVCRTGNQRSRLLRN